MPDFRKNYKQTKGNKYQNNAEFAEEVVASNNVHPAQNNPRDRGLRK